MRNLLALILLLLVAGPACADEQALVAQLEAREKAAAAPDALAECLLGLGDAALQVGKPEAADPYYLCGLYLTERDPALVARTLTLLRRLAQTRHQRRHHPDAEAYYRRELALRDKTNQIGKELVECWLGVAAECHCQLNAKDERAALERAKAVAPLIPNLDPALSAELNKRVEALPAGP
jgi:tetratricopeptide (TPR) repeat protein